MPNGQIVLQFYENHFSEPFFTQKMSDGTLKLFAYYLLLHERNPRQLVFIEEPENGLYHHYLADLAEEMRKNVGTGFSKQLFVTTHSPFFVNSLPPEDVWVLEKGEDGFSTAKRASDYKFVKALTEEGATAVSYTHLCCPGTMWSRLSMTRPAAPAACCRWRRNTCIS